MAVSVRKAESCSAVRNERVTEMPQSACYVGIGHETDFWKVWIVAVRISPGACIICCSFRRPVLSLHNAGESILDNIGFYCLHRQTSSAPGLVVHRFFPTHHLHILFAESYAKLEHLDIPKAVSLIPPADIVILVRHAEGVEQGFDFVVCKAEVFCKCVIQHSAHGEVVSVTFSSAFRNAFDAGETGIRSVVISFKRGGQKAAHETSHLLIRVEFPVAKGPRLSDRSVLFVDEDDWRYSMEIAKIDGEDIHGLRHLVFACVRRCKMPHSLDVIRR